MNKRVKAVLATLPYREMRELSREIVQDLPHQPTEDRMAMTLSGLAEKEDSEAVSKEKELLHSMFTRKKQIVILPFEEGFKVSIPAQDIHIYSDNVRDGVSQALDNLVALRVLR